MGALIFLRMIPLTRPASEFQLTWSPTLKAPGMAIPPYP
jgi:hypothetical protein